MTHRDPRLATDAPPWAATGAPLGEARAAVVLLHGRGATAESILSLAPELARAGGLGAGQSPVATRERQRALARFDVAYLAPQAAGGTWYPRSFLAPLAANEPHLSASLGLVAEVVARVAAAGIAAERTLLLGFSQGACLALEFAVRNARRWGGVVAFTGGLLGPAGTVWDYAGSLAGAPVFLGAGDPDPHVPRRRVEETAAVLRGMGAAVDLRIYPGLGHTVNENELAAARALVALL
jgi:predicted esterase